MAFTLIELLVVIAIIAICGVAFARAGSSQGEGATHACVNNVKQVALAMMLYVDDHGGAILRVCPTPPTPRRFRASHVERLTGALRHKLSFGDDQHHKFLRVRRPGDNGLPQALAADPFNQVTPRPRSFANFYAAPIA